MLADARVLGRRSHNADADDAPPEASTSVAPALTAASGAEARDEPTALEEVEEVRALAAASDARIARRLHYWERFRLRAPDAGRILWAMGKLKWRSKCAHPTRSLE